MLLSGGFAMGFTQEPWSGNDLGRFLDGAVDLKSVASEKRGHRGQADQ